MLGFPFFQIKHNTMMRMNADAMIMNAFSDARFFSCNKTPVGQQRICDDRDTLVLSCQSSKLRLEGYELSQKRHGRSSLFNLNLSSVFKCQITIICGIIKV